MLQPLRTTQPRHKMHPQDKDKLCQEHVPHMLPAELLPTEKKQKEGRERTTKFFLKLMKNFPYIFLFSMKLNVFVKSFLKIISINFLIKNFPFFSFK